jgi:hypothetical protein
MDAKPILSPASPSPAIRSGVAAVLAGSATDHLAGQDTLPPATGKDLIMLHLGPGAAVFAVFALLVWVIGGRSLGSRGGCNTGLLCTE